MTDRIVIPVHYDFASTLCYVAHRVLERLGSELADLEIELAWLPLDLADLTGLRRGEAVDGSRLENAHRVARELGVVVRAPERWMDSRPAHAIALAVEATERERTWRERVWSAVYEEGRPLDDPEGVTGWARELGIDPDERDRRRALAALELRTELAREEQVTGVPTFMLGEWPLGGIQEEATMRSMFRRFARRRRSLS
jgi:predicted DsbA family dithiol-disulfide isomerase